MYIDIKLHGPLPRDTHEVAEAVRTRLQSRSDDHHYHPSRPMASVSIRPGHSLRDFSHSLLRSNTVATRPIYGDDDDEDDDRRKTSRKMTTKKTTHHILCCYAQGNTIQPLSQLEAEYTELAASLCIHKPLYILLHHATAAALDAPVHSFRLWALTFILQGSHQRDIVHYIRAFYTATLDIHAIRFMLRCAAGSTRIIHCDRSDASYTRFADAVDLLLLPVNLNACVV